MFESYHIHIVSYSWTNHQFLFIIWIKYIKQNVNKQWFLKKIPIRAGTIVEYGTQISHETCKSRRFTSHSFPFWMLFQKKMSIPNCFIFFTWVFQFRISRCVYCFFYYMIEPSSVFCVEQSNTISISQKKVALNFTDNDKIHRRISRI